MRLDITTTNGTSGALGTIASRESRRLYHGYYRDVETALYKGVARALQRGRGLRGVSIDGDGLETRNVVDRLEVYLGGMVGGPGGPDDSDFRLTTKMVAMLEEVESYVFF